MARFNCKKWKKWGKICFNKEKCFMALDFDVSHIKCAKTMRVKKN